MDELVSIHRSTLLLCILFMLGVTCERCNDYDDYYTYCDAGYSCCYNDQCCQYGYSSTSDGDSSGLSAGAIVGIVFGCIFGLSIIGTVISQCIKSKNNTTRASVPSQRINAISNSTAGGYP